MNTVKNAGKPEKGASVSLEHQDEHGRKSLPRAAGMLSAAAPSWEGLEAGPLFGWAFIPEARVASGNEDGLLTGQFTDITLGALNQVLLLE